ncbi:MAG: hypothetical protein IH851_11435, partial [Armatimonadetes bacterium]|nr:hypothetical protein [Armatimonadota bacterium]
RGFYLKTNYFWANPNFHTLIPYDDIEKTVNPAQALVDALTELDTTHVYISLRYLDREDRTVLESRLWPDIDPLERPLKEPFRGFILDALEQGLLRRYQVFDNTTTGPTGLDRPRAYLFEIVSEESQDDDQAEE